MAILLYPSGITETYEPTNYCFTDEEILHIFKEYNYVRSFRLFEIPNTWCVWGQNSEIDDTDFNKLGSTIVKENIYSVLMFIHDSQIDQLWNLTDNIIYSDYNKFKEELLIYFDEIAGIIIDETNTNREEQGKDTNLVYLNTIGPTNDKRVLFEFDPKSQKENFYKDEFFSSFADKIYDFLTNNFKEQDLFYVFFDKKSVIFVKDDNVSFLMDVLIDYFKRNEKYETCQYLKTIHDRWVSYKNKKTKKKKKEIK